jgi:hypothetical protein
MRADDDFPTRILFTSAAMGQGLKSRLRCGFNLNRFLFYSAGLLSKICYRRAL